MSSNFKSITGKLGVFSVIVYLTNMAIVPNATIAPKFLIISHLFFFVITCLLLYLFDWVARNYVDRAGYLFIAFLFIKIIIGIIA